MSENKNRSKRSTRRLIGKWLSSPRYRLIALILMMPSLSFGAKDSPGSPLRLPPLPKTGAQKNEAGQIVLSPPDYLQWINWYRLAQALPAKCEAVLKAQQDKSRIRLTAGAGRCAAAGQVIAAEAARQSPGVSPLLAFALTITGLVLGAMAGAFTVLVLQ